MKAIYLFLAMLVIAGRAGAADALTEKLQRGLFEEEANHNLDAAIKEYQSVVAQSDEQRKVIATALFRLGECYRKLGRTNEANAQYQRILRDFSEQEALVKLSRDIVNAYSAAGSRKNPEDSEAERQIESRVAVLRTQLAEQRAIFEMLQKLTPDQLLQVLPQIVGDVGLKELQTKLNVTEGELTTLRGSFGLEHPAIQAKTALLKTISTQLDDRLKGIVTGMKLKADTLEVQLNALQVELQKTRTGTTVPSWKTVSDPEQVRLLQEEIKLAEQKVTALESLASDRVPPGSVLNAKRDVLAIRRLLPENSSLPRQRSLLNEQIKIVEHRRHDATASEKAGRVSPTEVISLRRESLALQREMAGLTEGSAVSATATPAQSGMTQAEAEELARVKTLARNSPDLLQSSGAGSMNQLQLAARDGHYSVVEFILAQGVNANGPERGSPPLLLAAERGHLRIVQLLLDKGADVNAANAWGRTALMSACESGFRSVVDLLLARGADVNRITESDATALHFAVWKGHAGLAELLLQRGANPNVLSHYPSRNNSWSGAIRNSPNLNAATPLHLATASGFTSLVELLLKSGASASATNYDRITPLHLAATMGNTNLCTLLLDKGADPNVQAQDEYTPLVRAIETGRPEVVTLLLAKGADVNRPTTNANRYFYYPLHIALSKTRAILDALLASKPNLEVVNGENQTPLLQAVNANSSEMVETLLTAGANPNHKWNGTLPVLIATAKGNLPMVTALLKHGANPNVMTTDTVTPLSYAQNVLKNTPRTAAQAGGIAVWEQIERTLLEHGANENLRRLSAITYTRPTWTTEDNKVFYRGTNDYNRHTLFELLAGVFSGRNAPAFPDLAHVTLERIEGTNAKPRELTLNIDEMVRAGQCSNDLRLEWGDRISFPELDHPLNEGWPGISQEMRELLTRCLTRRVKVVVKQETNVVKLVQEIASQPHFPGGFSRDEAEARIEAARRLLEQQNNSQPRITPALPTVAAALPQEKPEKVLSTFRLKEVVYGANVLRASSDATRVRVTRRDPNQTNEWVIDLTKVATNNEWTPPGLGIPSSNQQNRLWPQHDLWLRDGDVIEIPEKQ